MVRDFARYLATLDPKSEIPPADLLPGPPRRITPYLYCEREITELMAVAGALTPALKGATYRTIIGLLAVTGVRIGEALALDREDVWLDDGVLRLRVAKQHKQRLVSLHETTTDALSEYARVRDRACPRPATAAFFFSTSGARICGSVFDQVFRKVDELGSGLLVGEVPPSDSLRLLLCFAQEQTGKPPNRLDFTDLDAPLIGAFLQHLDRERGNSPATRNARLAAIHSLLRYAALRHPEHAASIARVLGIPATRHRKTTIPTSTAARSTRSWPRRIEPHGSGAATTRCCCSPSRPACASPNSSM
jgi:Phage integrase family